MRIYLSSYRIPTPDNLINLIGKSPSETKTAVIPNAQDYYAERARNVKIRDVTGYLELLGFADNVVIDLRDYTTPEQLKIELQKYGMMWVMGGNTFCLSYEIDRSGLHRIIKELLESGVVYAGESAGALIAGNSLEGVEFADPPEFAERVVKSTLNLVPNFILPHADNHAFADAIQKTRELHIDDPTLIELADNQALAIDGSESKITTGQ